MESYTIEDLITMVRELSDKLEGLQSEIEGIEATIGNYSHGEVIRIGVDKSFEMIENLQERVGMIEDDIEVIKESQD